MYILDTNALKSISKQELELICKNNNITISHITFYELLKHIDETNNGKNFNNQKGIVLMCKLPRILLDSFTLHAISVGAEKDVKPSKYEETTIIQQLLEKLEKSNTLEGFYHKHIIYQDGAKFACHDVVQNIKKELEANKSEYSKLLNNIKSMLIEQRLGKNTTPDFIYNNINMCINHLKTTYIEKDGIHDNDLLSKVYNSIYIFYGYTIIRALECIENGNFNNKEYKIDPNNFEDARIIFHLNLISNDALITNDGGIIKAFKRTIEALKYGQKNTNIRVLNVKGFLSEISI